MSSDPDFLDPNVRRRQKKIEEPSSTGFMTRPNGPVWPDNWKRSMTWEEIYEQAWKDRMFDHLNQKQLDSLNGVGRRFFTMTDAMGTIEVAMQLRDIRPVSTREKIHNT